MQPRAGESHGSPFALVIFTFSVVRKEPLMSRVLQAGFTGLAAIMLLGTVWLQPANARILCQGEFQVTKYGLIATPYCADEEIARVRIAMGGTEKPLRSVPTL